MGDALIVVLVFYPMFGAMFGIMRRIEWDDTNLLRLVLVGAGWPLVVVWYVFRAARATTRYFQGRFWKELAEIAPAPPARIAEAKTPESEYQVGQWRE